ncbi:MAG: hypothetical protein AAFY50_06700 [Cyanobacteria bacterium J06648_1]
MPYEQLDVASQKPVLSWANHELDRRETQISRDARRNRTDSLPL